MKVRLDFVTNSSTSSFICEVCGDVQAERGMCLSDAEMIECENYHVVCMSHLGEVPEDGEFPYEVPAEFCPICSLTHVRDKDMLDYVLKMVAAQVRVIPEKDKIGNEIREGFHNLGELREWCDED